MNPLLVMRIMKFAILAAEVAQLIYVAASIVGRHGNSRNRLPFTNQVPQRR